MMPAVKRLFVLALLLIMPLHFSWAAAAVYCEHDDKPVSHFGHHAHAEDADFHKANGDANGKVHGDCGYCHAAAVQASIFIPGKPPVLPPSRVYAEGQPPSFTSHISEGPRRPDRLSVA